MKKKNIRKFIYVAVMLVSVSLTSCLGDLDVTPIDPSVNQVFDQSAVFAKIYAGFQLTGLQGPAGNADVSSADEGQMALYRSLWNLNELTTDEVCWAYEGNYKIDELQRNKVSEGNPWTENVYQYTYIQIVMANSFLEQTASKTDAETIKERAEVRFIRALHYYNMMDLFGNPPFVTKVSDEAPPQIKRAELFAWIENELKEIEPDLYQNKAHDYYRVDVVADWLLLARLYLNAEVYTGTAQWNNAAIYAKKVIDSDYKLATKYRYLFMGDNAGSLDASTVNDAPNEIIFPVFASSYFATSYSGSTYLVASLSFTDMTDPTVSNYLDKSKWGCNRIKLPLIKKFFSDTTQIVNIMDARTKTTDERAIFYTKGRPIIMKSRSDAAQGPTSFKFTNGRADGDMTKVYDTRSSNWETFPNTDIPLMRKAEAYLTYAEAVLRGATAIGMTAKEAIDMVRNRAHASLKDSYTKDDVLDEWSREFQLEGRRRIDLIRFGYYGGDNTYLWDWKGGTLNGAPFSKNYNVFPLPQSDLNMNSNLKQNPGYN